MTTYKFDPIKLNRARLTILKITCAPLIILCCFLSYHLSYTSFSLADILLSLVIGLPSVFLLMCVAFLSFFNTNLRLQSDGLLIPQNCGKIIPWKAIESFELKEHKLRPSSHHYHTYLLIKLKENNKHINYGNILTIINNKCNFKKFGVLYATPVEPYGAAPLAILNSCKDYHRRFYDKHPSIS